MTQSARPRGAKKFPEKPSPSTGAEIPLTHGFLNSFDETKLFYTVEGTGLPLVFCYGLVCSSLHWTYQIQKLRESHQTIWFDYRGHQNSETPKDLKTMNVEAMGKDLGTILDGLEIDRAVLLGHSMGVNVVLDYYQKNPDRVAGMVLANGTPRAPAETIFSMNVTQKGFEVLQMLNDASPTLFRKIWELQKDNRLVRTIVSLAGFNPHLTPKEDIQKYINEFVEMDPKLFLTLLQNYDQFDATAWLHEISVPTLILAGENDKVIPLKQQKLMHQLIPDSKLEVIAHGSHCPQMDLPQLVNLKIEIFLKEMGWV